ncbi:MAG: N-acetyltransferase, partial [Bacteroidales bacterium]|nr:N-acetyltransferase [Bacteroidales bacterium]
MSDIIIRKACLEDAADILAIYAPYVENTAISFEYEAPSLEEFRHRMKHHMEKYPYLVAEQNGKLLGYAYAAAFHPRKAFQWLAETSIYLAPQAQGLGLGRRLYEALE